MQTTGTQKIIWAVIGVIVLAGAFMLLQKGGPADTPSLEGVNTEQKGDTVTGETPVKAVPVNPDEVSAKASFKDLLGKAGAQKCTVSQSSDLSKSSGVFYTAGGKGRGEFESTILSGPAKGTVSQAKIIIDADTMYTWDEKTKQGIKLSLKDADGGASLGDAGSSMATQLNQSYDYDCESWKADPSMFVVPAGVVMTDMSAMMKSLPQVQVGGQGEASMGGMPAGMDMSAMCASCDQAGAERDACRAALGCN